MAEELPSTQSRLKIQDIKDDILITREGRFVMILQATAVNFDLLSEAEQDAMIASYAQVLNSLTFPIEIVIHTRRMDISSYLAYLDDYLRRQTNKSLAQQIAYYRDFVRQLVVENNVLFKKFYLIIPYISAEKSKFSVVDKMIGSVIKSKQADFSAAQLEAAKENLKEKREEMMNLFGRMGIKLQQLGSRQILELFYEIYNPSQAQKQHLVFSAQDYTIPIVQPSLE